MSLMTTFSHANSFSTYISGDDLAILTTLARINVTFSSPSIIPPPARTLINYELLATSLVADTVDGPNYLIQMSTEPMADNLFYGSHLSMLLVAKNVNFQTFPTNLPLGILGNATFSVEIITSNYNATLCANQSYISLSGDIMNLITVNTIEGCPYISDIVYVPCIIDDDCDDTLVCTDSWIISTLVVLPQRWCIPAKPIEAEVVMYFNITYPLGTSRSEGSTILSEIAASLDAEISEWCQNPQVEIVTTTNDTLFNPYATISVLFSVYKLSQFCQAVMVLDASITTWKFIDPNCVIDGYTVPGVFSDETWVIPHTINESLNCGLISGGFAPCNTSIDCDNGYQCAIASVFDRDDLLACQNNIQTNIIDYNISITPTAANTDQNNTLINYAYLVALLADLQQELTDKDCLFLDSAQTAYIPQNAPYLTASLYVSHVNISDCLDIVLEPYPSSFMTTQALPLFSVEVISTQNASIPMASCVSDDGILILSGSCEPTALATHPVLHCAATSDCSATQSCEAISSSHVCLVPPANRTEQNDNSAGHSISYSLILCATVIVLSFMS